MINNNNFEILTKKTRSNENFSKKAMGLLVEAVFAGIYRPRYNLGTNP